ALRAMRLVQHRICGPARGARKFRRIPADPPLARSVKDATNTRGGLMEATTTLGPGWALPEEERIAATYQHLLRRLSHQSVVKHFDAYADIDWDADEHRIDPEDPRWELGSDDVLGATAWYRAQPQATRARLGLHLVATKMKIGTQFEHVQRTALRSGQPIHPLLRRIMQIHVTEEARHLCFARHYLRAAVPRLGAAARARLALQAPLVLGQMAQAMLRPSADVVRTHGIPADVIAEAYTRNPRHRENTLAALAK